ncbi:hypothetical protein [Kangiella sp.]|uniref:hypothetical protein n=1 Tax=Kangiella sp. TaxID=1920245 RepID=UPI0019959591|nr:hypothetical protein [Kangiella sp.]MBD3652712.1 hypothetical protein [Kangiella sp.]
MTNIIENSCAESKLCSASICKFISIIFCICFSLDSLAKPKSYQSLLMNEPASLLDISLFKARLELEDYIQKHQVETISINDLESFDWLVRSKYHHEYNYSESKRGTIRFDWNSGSFLYEFKMLSAIAVDYKRYKDKIMQEHFERSGLLDITQNNFSLLCSDLLIQAASQLHVAPYLHEGYTTKGEQSLPDYDLLYNKFERDTQYSYVIEILYLKEPLSVKCVLNGPVSTILKENLKSVRYEYDGPWHNLKKMLMTSN